MVDQPQADIKAESADTQKEPMPSSEQTPPESEVAGSEKSEGGKAGKVETSLPEGAKERTTEQFEKLRKQLSEEKEKRLRAERVFQQIEQMQRSQPQTPAKVDYFNPETGEVNVDRLEGRIGQVESEAKKALSTAQRIISDNDQKQERIAFKAHPELNPSNKKFDEDFHKAVVGYLATAYADGKYITLKQAADKIKTFSKSDLKKAQEQGAVEALEKLTPKEQASLEATGRSDRRKQITNLDDLRRRTRHGDVQALQERLKKIPIVGR